MNKENLPIERQISELIKSAKCTFKLCSTMLNVVGINNVSILNYNKGDFGKWNTKYSGCVQLTVAYEISNSTKQSNYGIEGYVKIEDNTVIDIDKMVSVYQR